MRPDFLVNMSYAMADVYAGTVDQILINLAKYFPYIKDDDEAFAVARRLVEMKVIPEEDVPSFLGLDGENRRPKVETADEESTSGPMPVQEEEDAPSPSAAGSAAAPSQEPEKESEQGEQKEEPEKPRPSAPAYSVHKPSDKGAGRPEAVPVDNWAALEKFFNEDMDF